MLTQRYRDRSTSENIYLLLAKADILEKSLTNLRLSIYEERKFYL
ncbi:MAG: hypothetical protein QNJ74_25230 [Trichodesmium sp. MO_231.B1]|nr:hypothetical protein [Trichodesmium sp. MO_231.B1]